MAFGVEDFQDLVRLLEQHPEWRAELRRLVLTDDLLDLPAVVHELAVAQQRTEEQVRALVFAQQRTQEQLHALTEAQRRAEDRLARAEEVLVGLGKDLRALRDQAARTQGWALEYRYREHAGGYFGPLARRVRVVGADELDDLLDEGVASGALDEPAAHDVRLADLILRGRRPGEDQPTYLVVEVSVGVGPSDVERAIRRAQLLGRLRPTLPVVAGEWTTAEAQAQATAGGVWRVVDGRVLAPGGG